MPTVCAPWPTNIMPVLRVTLGVPAVLLGAFWFRVLLFMVGMVGGGGGREGAVRWCRGVG